MAAGSSPAAAVAAAVAVAVGAAAAVAAAGDDGGAIAAAGGDDRPGWVGSADSPVSGPGCADRRRRRRRTVPWPRAGCAAVVPSKPHPWRSTFEKLFCRLNIIGTIMK